MQKRLHFLVALLLFFSATVMAQVTTSSLDGKVVSNGENVVGAVVTAIHEPSGTRYNAVTNADGRVDGPMLAGADLRPGVYRLVFDVERYFRAKGVALPTPAFLGQVPLDFGVADAQAHYHVPLLVSPWAYSTYRGS